MDRIYPDLKELEIKTMDDLTISPQRKSVIYGRQSSKSNKDNSIDMQLRKGLETALKYNIFVIKTYSEKESAYEIPYFEREEFKKLLEDAKLGLFKNIIVFKRDRLSRRTEDFLRIKKIFKNLGIRIIFSCESEFKSDDTPTSDFVESILAGISEFEPSLILQRALEGRKAQREEGIYSPSHCPFGYIISNKQENSKISTVTSNSKAHKEDNYVPDPKTSNFLNLLFNSYSNNNNLITSGDLYNYMLNNGTEIPDKFTPNRIPDILKNPIYAGLILRSLDYKHEDSFIIDSKYNFIDIDKAYYKPARNVKKVLNSEEIWYSAAKKWFINHDPYCKRNKKTQYLFKGLLFCSKCSKPMTLINNIFKCKIKGCIRIKKNILIDSLLEQIVADVLNDKIFENQLDEKIKSIRNKITGYQNRLKILNHDQQTLLLEYIQNSQSNELSDKIKENVQNCEKTMSSIYKATSNANYFEEIRKCIISRYETVCKLNLVDAMKSSIELTQKYLFMNIERVNVYARGNDFKYEVKFSDGTK